MVKECTNSLIFWISFSRYPVVCTAAKISKSNCLISESYLPIFPNCEHSRPSFSTYIARRIISMFSPRDRFSLFPRLSPRSFFTFALAARSRWNLVIMVLGIAIIMWKTDLTRVIGRSSDLGARRRWITGRSMMDWIKIFSLDHWRAFRKRLNLALGSYWTRLAARLPLLLPLLLTDCCSALGMRRKQWLWLGKLSTSVLSSNPLLHCHIWPPPSDVRPRTSGTDCWNKTNRKKRWEKKGVKGSI